MKETVLTVPVCPHIPAVKNGLIVPGRLTPG
jgi:hypothetical protein